MKLKTLHISLILFLYFGFINAQTDSLKKKSFIKLYAFGLNAGTLMNNEPLTVYGLMKMAPGNKLLQQDYNSFEKMYGAKGEGVDFALQSAFIFYNKSKKAYNNRQELRISIRGQSSQGSDLTYERKERIRFDTLMSHTNPKIYYIDTVKSYTYFLENEQINFLVGLTYAYYVRPQNKIFSAYIGGGLGYGMILQNTIKATMIYRESFEDQDNNNYTYYTKSEASGNSISEESQLPHSNIYQGAINGGLLMRFSNLKKNRVSNFAINLDGTAGLRLLDLPNIGIYKQFFFNLNFGLKFYLKREVYK